MKYENDSDDDFPLHMRFQVKQLTKPLSEGFPMGSSDSEDEKPLALRHKQKSPNESFLMDNEHSADEKPLSLRHKPKQGIKGSPLDSDVNHVALKSFTMASQLIFPPSYKPHGFKMLYKGKPVDLSAEEEEVSFYWTVSFHSSFLHVLLSFVVICFFELLFSVFLKIEPWKSFLTLSYVN